jgi:hypothetical protein
MQSMRFSLAIALLLGVTSVVSSAQNSKATNYKARTGKGTPASLTHHKDNSDLVLHANRQTYGGANAELNKIEQQNLHSSTSSGAHASVGVKPAPLPKIGAAKPAEKNPAINFSGHTKSQTTMTTQKSGGKSSMGMSPKMH